MKDQSDDPSLHERTLLQFEYITGEHAPKHEPTDYKPNAQSKTDQKNK